ncbi:DUF11 domain-containing protein [Fodinibius salinus]|nr:DUF11 domain-containing protein [Fodinibius salinus]
MNIRTSFVLFLFLFAQVLVTQAQGNEDLTSELKTYKISTDGAGNETAVEVSEIQPGDTIEYRLTYTNNTENSISNLVPTLPIPAGVQYLSDTAEPALNAASLSSTGNNFQKLPITREVTQKNGEVVEQEVPASEYRRLRWAVESLEAQGSVTLRARVQVNDIN